MGNQPSQQNIRNPQIQQRPQNVQSRPQIQQKPQNMQNKQQPRPQMQSKPQPRQQMVQRQEVIPKNNMPPADLLSQVAHPMHFIPPPTKSVTTLMDRPQSTKGSIKDADLMNINERMEEFKKSQKSEEQQFLDNLEKQKETFYKNQQSKKSRFDNELKEFEQKYNPFRILHLEYNATEDDVKKAYRKFALKYHPDKPTGDPKKFMMITQAYVYLLQKIKEMSGQNKSHKDMQNEAREYFEEMEKKRQEMRESATLGYDPDDQMEIASDKNFNADKFNKIFEKNRMPTQYDKGYGGDWGEDSDQDEPVVMNKKFSMDIFNQMFDEQKKKKIEKKPERQLMVIEEPEPQLLSNLQFEELGSGEIDNFTSGRNSGMNFTDYKAAYTRNNVLEYDEKFNRGDYKNIDHLVKERGKANFDLTDDDKARLQRREMMTRKQEEERVNNMMAWDKMAEQYSQRANMHFIKNK